MRIRWTVLVARDGVFVGRTFGNFETLTDAERLAENINKGLADNFTAFPIPFHQGVTSARAALALMPDRYKAAKEGQ